MGPTRLGLFWYPVCPITRRTIMMRRLKDKLGTRSMPSAEIDFQGATAYAVGPVDGVRDSDQPCD